MLITQNEILNPSITNLPSKNHVIKLCRKQGPYDNHFAYSAGDRDIFIKYNNASMDEAHSQLFFYNEIMKNSHSMIRIPEIYHAFKTDTGSTYILMEHINIKDRASNEQRAQAISELVRVPPPPGTFGSMGGGLIRHPIFQDETAPVHFASVAELEAYINRVCFYTELSSNHLSKY